MEDKDTNLMRTPFIAYTQITWFFKWERNLIYRV